jgi:hypothetical protein
VCDRVNSADFTLTPLSKVSSHNLTIDMLLTQAPVSVCVAVTLSDVRLKKVIGHVFFTNWHERVDELRVFIQQAAIVVAVVSSFLTKSFNSGSESVCTICKITHVWMFHELEYLVSLQLKLF